MAIPRNIFQTCRDSSGLEVTYTENIEKIRRMNPGWNFRLFDDQEVRKLFSEFFDAEILKLISRVNPKYGVVLADLFRYVAIYKYGGVYLDIKSTLTKPLDQVIKEEHVFLISQWRNRLGEEYAGYGMHLDVLPVPGGEFQQWFLVAQPGHPILREVIERVIKNIVIYDQYVTGVGRVGVLRLSGPIVFTNTVYPLIRKYPCQLVDIQNYGFKYAISRALHAGETSSSSHYTNLTEPIVL